MPISPRAGSRPVELERALDEIDPAVREAIELLAPNLRTVATELLPPPTRVELPQGQIVSTRHVPVQRAGLYVPGGGAAYPSSAVMAIVPAQVAGVPQICVCSPPAADGRVHSAILAVCALLGVTEVYAAGGAQAVAAMALGTEAIPAVDVVVGPGNAYVEEAKRRLFGEVGIESLAGPSELIILADATAPAEHLAWDLMAQAEHGAGAQSVLVSPDPDVIAAVAEHLAEGDVTLIETDSWETAIAFVNEYAPEHLQLAVADPAAVLEQIVHAGAIFLGHHSGAAFGDYVAGSNHILPTAGNARFSSGLGPVGLPARPGDRRDPRVRGGRAGAAAGRTGPRRRTSQPRPLGVHPSRTTHRILERTSQLMQLNREVIAADGAPKPFAGAPYNQAIRAGNFVFCAGQVGLDPETGALVEGGIEAQTRRVLENVAAVLAGAGLTPEHVVKTTVFVADLGDFAAVNAIYAEYFTHDPPARSTVQVAALPAGAAVEIEVVAAD